LHISFKPPVAVEQWVYAHQSVVSRCQSYEWAHAVLFSRIVEEGEAFKESD
jgi:hypothetical protein